MAFLIRSMVSGDRQRFMGGGYDLDLTYITPRIIAMGFPASGIEGAWRNSINEVAMMLKRYHSGKYMVWNLSDRPYDYSIFEDQVMEFGFPDHHAPPLDLLFKIMLSLYNWLKADPLNIAVIHCLGGKGRTGTVIACYFLLLGLFDDPTRALEYFANKRSVIALGVTQPGQRSCVGYFAKILQQSFIPYQIPYYLYKIVMYGVNQQNQNQNTPFPLVNQLQATAFRPIIKVYDVRSYPKKLIYSTENSAEAENNIKRWTNHEVVPNNAMVWMFPKEKLILKGDVLFKVYHSPIGGGKKIYVFRFSFHTAFLEGGILQLSEADLSTEKKFSAYRKDNFFMHLFMDEPTDPPPLDEDPENAIVESYCQQFQKIYKDLRSIKMDQLDPKFVVNSTSTTAATTTSHNPHEDSTTTTTTITTVHTTSVKAAQKQKPLPPPPSEIGNAKSHVETSKTSLEASKPQLENSKPQVENSKSQVENSKSLAETYEHPLETAKPVETSQPQSEISAESQIETSESHDEVTEALEGNIDQPTMGNKTEAEVQAQPEAERQTNETESGQNSPGEKRDGESQRVLPDDGFDDEPL
jgi:phosphatidylinositol-3,4,5-trisphosphate 3-phosphatase/dual-specificity protein phosphatase PTEN